MKPRILVLGTHHMSSTKDMVDQNGLKLLAHREQEILEILDRLKVYRPTKVAVEVEVKKQEQLNQEYWEYLSGNLTLPISEVYQIGFRLAKEMGHNQVERNVLHVSLKNSP